MSGPLSKPCTSWCSWRSCWLLESTDNDSPPLSGVNQGRSTSRADVGERGRVHQQRKTHHSEQGGRCNRRAHDMRRKTRRKETQRPAYRGRHSTLISGMRYRCIPSGSTPSILYVTYTTGPRVMLDDDPAPSQRRMSLHPIRRKRAIPRGSVREKFARLRPRAFESRSRGD